MSPMVSKTLKSSIMMCRICTIVDAIFPFQKVPICTENLMHQEATNNEHHLWPVAAVGLQPLDGAAVCLPVANDAARHRLTVAVDFFDANVG